MLENYRDLLLSLFPPGAAFVREVGSYLYKLCYGIAAEFVRIHTRALQLVAEADPRTANETIPEWEEFLGLPDECSPENPTQTERRDEIVNRFVGDGGQSKAYFIKFAQALGFTITILEYKQFKAGYSCAGDPLTNGEWIFVWQVTAPLETVKYFSAGKSVAGDPLASWGNDILECKINEAKPAHTLVIFNYV